MPTERGTPPMTVHKTPVPAHVMHSKILRRLGPSPGVLSRSDLMVTLRVAAIRLRGPRSANRAPIPRHLDNLVGVVRRHLAHHVDVAAGFGPSSDVRPRYQ